MAKKRYVHKTVRPSDGGRLLTATAEETVGISNYVEKQNFRRDLDGEVRREGWELLSGHVEVRDDTEAQPSSSVRLLHEFTDHLGTPRLVAGRGGALYAFIPNTGSDYVRHSAKKEASLVVETVDGSGGITAVGIINKGYGYPSGYVTLAVTSSGTSATLSTNIVGTYIDSVGITAAGSGYAVGDVVTATIDRYDALESGLPYWDETLGSTGWRLIASGLHNLDDAVEGVRRWECVEVNGHAIFNNGYDLPLIFKSDWDKAIPLYGLRENKVASVGTIQSYDGRLVCADIVEIDTGFDIVKGNALGTYGCIYDMTGYGSDITTRRNQYSMMWSAYGEPWLFNQSEPCIIKQNEIVCQLSGSDFVANTKGATFSVGDPVFIEGAGVYGGRLSLKHSGNATITGITATVATDTFSKTAHGLKDGERIKVVRVKGGGPVEGTDYYVELVDENSFKLNKTQTRRAIVAEVLNGTTLSFSITDHGAGYTSAPPVDLSGYTGGGTTPAPVINQIGQLIDIPDVTGWSTVTTTPQVVTIGRPTSSNVDVTTAITSMTIIKPDIVDQYRSIIDGAVKQISKVSISRTVPSATCSDSQYTTESTCTTNSGSWLFVHSAISYKIQINNEKYELTHDPSGDKDFTDTATAEDISSLFASRINEVSTEVFAVSGPDGLTLDSRIAGVAFTVTTSTTDSDGEISSAITTANSNSGATEAEIAEAYIQLYGTAVDVESETLSVNNAITISEIEGPFDQIIANGALVPTPVSGTYDPVYEISITINASLPTETTTVLSYDFGTWYNAGTYSSISTTDYPDIVGSAFLSGLATEIYNHPVLGTKISVSAYGWDSKTPYMWYWPTTTGDTITINSINNTTISYTPPTSGQDDVWENISAWASNTFQGQNLGSNYWYHASAGLFFWDGSSEWVYMTQDSSASTTNAAWVFVGRYDDSYYYMDGISVFKRKPEHERRIYLDAYAETTNETATLRRSVSIAGGTVFDYSLGAGYQDWQEDGTPIIKLEQIGDHLACYRENGYFLTSQTGKVSEPFTFKTRYQGRNVPSFRHSILNMGGKKHIYAGYNGIFELSLAQPQPIPSVTLAAATRFWEEISEAESEYVFTTNNVLTNEYFIHLPDPTGGYGDGYFSDNTSTIAYDYKYGTVSTINAAFTAGGSFRQPSSVMQPPPNDYAEFMYIMALDTPQETQYFNNGHYLAQYGIKAPVGSANAKSIYTREVYAWGEQKLPYDSKIKYGLITFEDTFNEKDLRSYILHVADVNSSVSVEIHTAYTTGATDSEKYLFGEENDPSSAIILSDLKNENAIPLYLRAPIFQDTIKVTGTVDAAQYTTHKITGTILNGDIHRITFGTGLSIQVTAPSGATYITQMSALVDAINSSSDSPVTASFSGSGLFGLLFSQQIILTSKDATAAFTADLTAPVNNGGSVVANVATVEKTTESSIKVIGRTFEVAGIYDRASMQMIGIGGSNVTS